MIAAIIIILVISGIIYFYDDFNGWKDKAVAFYQSVKTDLSKFFEKKISKPTRSEYEEVIRKKVSTNTKRVETKTKSSQNKTLTQWEIDYVWEGVEKRKRVPCINCEIEDMYQAPQKNEWRCGNCGQGIAIFFKGGGKNGFTGVNMGVNRIWRK